MTRAATAILLLLAGGTGLLGTALPRADATRHARSLDQALLFVPDAAQTKLVATGFEEPLADLFWARTVLLFGERYDSAEGREWTGWLGRMITTVNTLDPRWRTAYYYGGTILRASDAIEASDAVFAMGAENLPTDPFFPFSLGMNAYLYRDDAASAAVHLARAAALPGAPSWYAAASAAMHQEGGQRAAGIRYLEEVRATSDNPAIRADAEEQLSRLRHNDLVDGWADACRAFRDTNGRPLADLEEFGALGLSLPENPRGDAWIVGADGVVRSAAAEDERRRDAVVAEFRHLR